MIGLEHFLTVAAGLFAIGVLGIFLNRRNIVTLLMSIQLLLLAVMINFVAFSAHLQDVTGQVMTVFILVVAAAQVIVGLAIVICFFRIRSSIDVEGKVMKG